MSNGNPAPVPDVVLLHGWLMGPDLWDTHVSALGGVARLHPLAAPAHGTPGPSEGFTMAAWADQVIRELDDRGVEQAVFVGHSMSGWLAQRPTQGGSTGGSTTSNATTTSRAWPPSPQP